MEIANLDHLGLVAGTIDEIGIEEIINRKIGENSCEKISAGKVVKAMIMNALGMISSPLYLFAKFFEGKGIEHLIGEGVKASYLNDDRLGRVLDKVAEKGSGKIFVEVALETLKKYEIRQESAHCDGTSFHVHGEYKDSEIESEKEEPKTIIITHGYSRDHRPDLKQYTMELICVGDGDIPVWMKMGDGNEVETQQCVKTIKEFKKTFEFQGLMVADAVLYTQENLQYLGNIEWLSRVPLTIKAAKKLVTEVEAEELKPCQQEGYSYVEKEQNYGTIPQRWLVIESEKRRQSDLKQLEKKMSKEYEKHQKDLKELKSQKFACQPDAMQAAKKLLKKSKYHKLTEIKTINVTHNQKKGSQENYYSVSAKIIPCEEKLEPIKRQAGRFIIATNVLDKQKLDAEKMIWTYKNQQQSVERCFGFLKDPMFFTDSVFLKSPKRIEALGLIMALALLVYKVTERQVRQTLQKRNQGIKNQLGRLTSRPTLRWIFQCFQSIHVYINQGEKQISNLTNERKFILKFFPPSCQRYYLITTEEY